MITILTYHDILPQQGTQHYSVPIHRLKEHLDVLLRSGMLPLDPALLQEPDRIGSASFFLTFDDGHELHAKLTAPLLTKHGIRGIFFVPTQRLDRPGFLKTTDVQTMSAAGHLFGLHGHQHRRLDKLAPEELAQDFSDSLEAFKRILRQKPWFFAPVGGYDSRTIRTVADSYGIRALRTMRWGLNHHPDPMGLETIPIHRDFHPESLNAILAGGRFGAGYRIKEILKNSLPDNLYKVVRERLSRFYQPSSLKH